jgi:transcriptional regulator with XRE-family HTH domain
MSSHPLVAALKLVCKSKGITYQIIANELGLTLTSVKRFMSGKTPMTLDRLDQMCGIANIDVFTLVHLAKPTQFMEPSALQLEQEQALADDDDLFLMFYSLAKGLPIRGILAKYRITEIRLNKALIKLERLGLIENLPRQKVKFLVARSVRWREQGPLSRKYEKQFEQEFLIGRFVGTHECRKFVSFPLSPRSQMQAAKKLRDVVRDIQDQSEVDLALDPNIQTMCTVLVGVRQWTPALLTGFVK